MKNTVSAVKAQRMKLSLNQSEFWSRVGVTQSGGSRYESGRAMPRPVAALLALAYGKAPIKQLANLRHTTADKLIQDGK